MGDEKANQQPVPVPIPVPGPPVLPEHGYPYLPDEYKDWVPGRVHDSEVLEDAGDFDSRYRKPIESKLSDEA